MFETLGRYTMPILIFILVVVVLLLIYLIAAMLKKKKYYTQIDDLEYTKYELSNKPVLFELNKLRNANKSERIVNLVKHWEKNWNELEEQFATVTENITYAEELISQREFIVANEVIADSKADLEQLGEQIEILLDEIQTLKNSETRNRFTIIGLKEAFEGLKNKHEEEQEKYQEFEVEIEELFKKIEELIFQFDGYMEDCNYDLADEVIESMKSEIEKGSILFERMPMYQESVDNEIRPLLKEVLNSYHHMSQSGTYLSHLQIEETIEDYQKQLDQVMDWIRAFEFAKIEQFLLVVSDNAKQMIDFMKKEFELQEIIQKDLEHLERDIEFITNEGKNLKESYDHINAYCSLSSEDEQNFELLLREIQIVYNGRSALAGKFAERKTPNSTLSREIISALNQVEQIKEQLEIFSQEVEKLSANEKECRERVLALFEHFSHLKGEYYQLALPASNEKINKLILRGNQVILGLFELLDQVPIDIKDIENELVMNQKEMDELTNELELEIGQVKLAEKILVYGHRYVGLGGMYLMDLTIAEDHFRQGHYKETIKKMHEILNDVEGFTRFGKVFDRLQQELNHQLSQNKI